MSVECEIVESLASATSTAPAQETVVLAAASASAGSTAMLGFSELATESATAGDVVTPEYFAILSSEAQAGDVVTPQRDSTAGLVSIARAHSVLTVALDQIVATSAQAAGTAIQGPPDQTVVTSARAASTVTPQTIADSLFISSAVASDRIYLGLEELATESAQAGDTATPRRIVFETAAESAQASSTALHSAVITQALMTSAAEANSWTTSVADMSLLVSSSAEARSTVWYRDPASMAWVLNTESAGLSQFLNFEFNSVAQLGDTIVAASEDGLYELVGADDVGDSIASEVQYGFLDFGSDFIKRVESVYLGYTADGGLQMDFEAKESGASEQTYTLESRNAADAPIASRVKPGKGLKARYWRIGFRNISGADFAVQDLSALVAESKRKVS